MLERIFGALGDILIFDQTVHQFAPVAIRHLDRSQAANYTEQGFPQLIDLVRGMLVDIDHIGSAPRDHLHETDPRKMTECFAHRSEEHTTELQSLMRISYAV